MVASKCFRSERAKQVLHLLRQQPQRRERPARQLRPRVVGRVDRLERLELHGGVEVLQIGTCEAGPAPSPAAAAAARAPCSATPPPRSRASRSPRTAGTAWWRRSASDRNVRSRSCTFSGSSRSGASALLGNSAPA